MTDDRRSQIEQVVADFEASGVQWTNAMVLDKVGGNYGQLADYLKARRAGTSAASPAPSAPDVASVAVLEPSAPSSPELAAAQARHAERKARIAEKLRLAKLQAAAAPPAPAPPAPRPQPSMAVSHSLHYTSPPPITVAAPPPDTRPELVIAREAARRWQEKAREAERREEPLKTQIAAFQARQTQLTAARKTVATVEALRTLKAELVAIEEELEILTRQHAPLAAAVRSLATPPAEAEAYSMLRGQAIEALDRARVQHFHGTSEADKAKRFRELVVLVGAEDVKRYVTDLTEPAQCRLPHNNPPWK